MEDTRKEILFGGFGGQGIITSGLLLSAAVSLYDRKEAVFIPSYGPEARGGACRAGVVVSEGNIGYPYVTSPDIFVCLSSEAYRKYISMLKKGGILIIESELVKVDDLSLAENKIMLYKIPCTKMAEELGNPIVANVIMLGYLAKITNIVSKPSLLKAISARVPGKFLELNMKAFELGYNYKEA